MYKKLHCIEEPYQYSEAAYCAYKKNMSYNTNDQ